MDAKALEDDIGVLRAWWCHGGSQKFDASDKARIHRVCEAAEAHLNTLPRTKEVEVSKWAVLTKELAVQSTWNSEEFARGASRGIPGSQVVRLTGTATVPA